MDGRRMTFVFVVLFYVNIGSVGGGAIFPLSEKNNHSESISNILNKLQTSQPVTTAVPVEVTRFDFIQVENNTSHLKSVLSSTSSTSAPVLKTPNVATEVSSMVDGTKYNGLLDVDHDRRHEEFASKETAIIKYRNHSHDITSDSQESEFHEKPSEVIAEISSFVRGTSTTSVNSKRIETTTAAGIAAGVCLAIALTGYVLVIVWRKVHQNSIGNLEELINEEDIEEDADLRHFELKEEVEKKRMGRGTWEVSIHGPVLQGSVSLLNSQKTNIPREDLLERPEESESIDCLTDRKSVLEEQKLGNSEIYVPECTSDGRYQKIQCYKSTGYCWCVHEDTGKPIPGTSVKDLNPKCDAVQTPSRPMKGCPEHRKQQFLKDLKEFLTLTMATTKKTRGDPMSLLESQTEDERIATWNFMALDINKNKVLERKEWKNFRTMISTNRKLRRCGKKLPRYCDVNHDRKISLTEWLNCLDAQRTTITTASAIVNTAPAASPSPRRHGLGPMDLLKEYD